MAQMNSRVNASPPLLRIEPFKGMNLSVTPTQIDHSQSPDMLNMNIDERGALNKRTGYERIIPHSLGDGNINGMFLYRKKDGTEIFLFAHGNKLYKGDTVPNWQNERLAKWGDDDLTQTWESEV
ncbi:hypothetical protein D0469_06980 [Peribacillus saganii]|uniref:Uncharacterized protein n=1 Tax=Peribacillus saganii TaxID=2303992 RepID=A0A372LQY4_9BACI|nr:hypothetical protein [Peribacillus saganii]RFU70337.1 hypothetical protein D0469_06980 [Peribacillus saganii]